MEMKSPPITFQVQWLLEQEDTIHVLHNNQNVTFETNHEDPEGRLGRAVSHPFLSPWVGGQQGA